MRYISYKKEEQNWFIAPQGIMNDISIYRFKYFHCEFLGN